ncbi:CBS domain-containing protein [Pseudonocardia sp. MH-G8]|uniref:CBS domain-containing protein n=1 Tax=Pseudonocardia sp. MH-G8 TaxID=1854588 RepID=UPI001E31D57A|nr:CBS domain-containing protein [Pseudonocardia sp. MH-G8]
MTLSRLASLLLRSPVLGLEEVAGLPGDAGLDAAQRAPAALRDDGFVWWATPRVAPREHARDRREVLMASTVAQIMARDPESVTADATVGDAAQRMRDADTGDVVVLDSDRLVGILTDRDIAVRVVAEGRAASTGVREVCSGQDLTTVTPDTSIDAAAQLMREKAVRRLPVVEGDHVVGVVSIGDLAIERDERSALADISATEANR